MAPPEPTTPDEQQPQEQEMDEMDDEAEEEEEMLEEVLFDVALIEAALADSSSSLAIDSIEITIDDGSGSDSGSGSNEAVDTIVFPSARLRSTTSRTPNAPVRQEAEAIAAPSATDAARWQPDPFELPGGDALPWRRAWLRDRAVDGTALGFDANGYGGDDQPPAALLPMAAACVLLLLLSSWGQLRRSRRRVLERQEDAWRRDVDLVESRYRDQTRLR